MPRSGSKIAQNKKANTTTQCCRWDFTLWDEISANEVRKTLKEYCKKYCFQQEQGEKSGGIHFQGRFSLKLKKRSPEVVKLFSKHWKGFHVTPTSNENKDNDFYVLKEDTRIDGPFTDLNEIYIPKDVENMKELWPFQKKIFNDHKIYDERTINMVIDTIGNKGKTRCTRYCCINGDAEEIPFAKDFRDIMRMSYDLGPRKCYFIDLPRALPKDRMKEFFAGLEKLKSGYAFDDRHRLKVRRFDPPNIYIFSNIYPDTSLLSKDMWKIWTINEDKELVPYNDDTIDALLEVKQPIEFLPSSESDKSSSDRESDYNSNSDSDYDVISITTMQEGGGHKVKPK